MNKTDKAYILGAWIPVYNIHGEIIGEKQVTMRDVVRKEMTLDRFMEV